MEDKEIKLKSPKKYADEIEFWVDDDVIIVDTEHKYMDLPTIRKYNEVYIPIKALELFGFKLSFNNDKVLVKRGG